MAYGFDHDSHAPILVLWWSGSTSRPTSGLNRRFFSTRAEAVEWLESQAHELGPFRP